MTDSRRTRRFISTSNILTFGTILTVVIATEFVSSVSTYQQNWHSYSTRENDVFNQRFRRSENQNKPVRVKQQTRISSIAVPDKARLSQHLNNGTNEEHKSVVTDIRLPRSIKPLHYHVKLIPFLRTNDSIIGSSALTFLVLEETSNVTMHIKGIVINNASVKLTLKDDIYGTAAEITVHNYDAEKQFYTAVLNNTLKTGTQYVIQMDFMASLKDFLSGFYRSSYLDENGNVKWFAATQFQPTDARKAFPCLDEPALKANFTIEVAREKMMTATSNMPLQESLPMQGYPDWMWDKFETSVPMSTYLVAFVVSEFEKKISIDKNTYDFAVWTRKAVMHNAEYALRIGPQASKFFEDYFQVPFPLPKQDMVALPDFFNGAMENWGLIIYREDTLLYDPTIATEDDKYKVGTIIFHEMAHQWFGNLVTPLWWTDLWLNEGFANYMEYVGINAVETAYEGDEMFIISYLHPVLWVDCLESSHPVSMEVQNPEQIMDLFDSISYDKGASIIRMMNHFLGQNTFRKGISKYLRELAFSNAEQDDLWQYLTDQSTADESLPTDINIKGIMDTWTLQSGFPLITVANQRNGTALITQERFLLSYGENSSDTSDNKWWVPITFATQDIPDFSITKPILWMQPRESRKLITGIPSNKWVIFNVQQTGFFRVNYDEDNWNAIIEQLNINYSVIHFLNRAQIIEDSLALARTGILPYDVTFRVLSYLKKEEEFAPWKVALNALEYLKQMFSHTGGYGALKEFYLSLTVPKYHKFSVQDRIRNSPSNLRKWAAIVENVCSLGYQPCVDKSVSLYRKWMKNPGDNTIIPAYLKSAVYCTAIQNGGYKEWKFAWNRYQYSDNRSERKLLLRSMGCTKESWIQGGFLERSLLEEKGRNMLDVESVITSVASTEQGKLIAWDFFKDRYDKILKLFGNSPSTLQSIIKVITSSLNTRNHLMELEHFQQQYEGRFGSAERALQQAIENSRHNLNWMDKHYDKVQQWLTAEGFVSTI